MPDMRGFSATLGPIGVGSLHLRLHCLSRMGSGQSSKVSKTVNSCAALLRCVRCVMNSAHAVGLSLAAFLTVGGGAPPSPALLIIGWRGQRVVLRVLVKQRPPCRTRWCLTARSAPTPRRAQSAALGRG